MKKHKLSIELEEEPSFDLIGLCCHKSDYRLCWAINDTLGTQLKKSDTPYMVSGARGKIISSHSLFEWSDQNNGVDYYLIKNKAINKFLIPEKSQVDFFMVINEGGVINLEETINKIKSINEVLSTYIFYPEEIISSKNLIFD